MRDLLAHCSDFRHWSPSICYAAELAAELGASLTGLYVAAPVPALSSVANPLPWLDEWIAYATDEVHCAMLAGHAFEEWTRSRGVAMARWQVALGDPRDVLDAASSWSDLVILGLNQDGTDPAPFACSMLLSGMACIAVPHTPASLGRLERVVIAWNGSSSSTRALHASIPMLGRASHVVLLRAANLHVPDAGLDHGPGFNPEAHLDLHGIRTIVETLAAAGEHAGPALVTAAQRHRADLLVMGADGKARRGGSYLSDTTHHVLTHSGVPLFMRH